MKADKKNKQINKENIKDKNVILTYSAIEQSRNKIMGAGRCLLNFLGIFPFIPISLALFSCYVIKLSDDMFKYILFAITACMIIILLSYIGMWINNMLKVLIIDDKGNLYIIKISTFWYKIKDRMYLLNPTGMAGGRLVRLFYMINNIRLVLDSVAENISYEEFIAMGRMKKISDIKDVNLSGKNIRFTGNITDKNGTNKKSIKLRRVYDKDEILCEYLVKYDKEGIEAAAETNFGRKRNPDEIIKIDNTPVRHLNKFIKFTLVWSGIMCWIAMLTISGDLNRLSKINAGEYVKAENDRGKIIYEAVDNKSDYFYESDYGNMYKPVIVIYLSVELVYGIMKGMDYLIEIKKQ